MSSAPLTLDTIRSLLAEQTQSIQTSMQNEMKILGDGIKAELQSQITQIHEKIDANQANVQSQINDLKVNVEKCTEQMNGTDDDFQRISKLNELKINGIAHTNNENLNEIFNEIAKLVEFDLSTVNNVPSIMRIYKRDHTKNISAPTSIVIVKFVANHIRSDFYSHYLKKIAAKKPIMSENINLPKGSRIIIGENLTVKNFGIFVEACKLERENKLCSVFTQDGLVQVRANKNKKAIAIRSLRQLELFTLANPPNEIQQNTANDITNATTSTASATAAQPIQIQQQQK